MPTAARKASAVQAVKAIRNAKPDASSDAPTNGPTSEFRLTKDASRTDHRDEFADLAANVTVAKNLPAVRRSNGTNPFVPLVKRSWDEEVALATPPVAESRVRAVRTAIRRAARQQGLGVSIRTDATPDGVVITFMSKQRATRNSADES